MSAFHGDSAVWPRVFVCAAAVVLASAGSALGQNTVTEWNAVLQSSIRTAGMGTPGAARTMALMNTAIYDAVNTIDKEAGGLYYTPYLVGSGAPSGASREAAAASAAHAVLKAVFPAQSAALDAQLASTLAGLGGGSAVTAGQAWGAGVGATLFGSRVGDGSSPSVPFVGTPGIGQWGGTFTSAQYATTTPWAIPSPSHYRPSGPPALDSAEYASAWDQVRRLGSATSAERTADQTEAALFWRLGGGSSTPAGIWTEIAGQAAANAGQGLSDSARMFAAMSIAVADSAIGSWDAKVAYNFWRPPAAIAQGDLDGNPLTFSDPSWVPLATEASPEYTSGSSTFGAAAAAVLASFLGDSTSVTMVSEFNGVDVRSWDSFSAMSAEQGMSRIWLGAHFMFSNLAGAEMGGSIADYVLSNYFAPVPSVGGVGVFGAVALAGATRRRRR